MVAFDRDLDESERTSVALMLTSGTNALTVGSKKISITGSAEMVIAGQRGNIQYSNNLKLKLNSYSLKIKIQQSMVKDTMGAL